MRWGHGCLVQTLCGMLWNVDIGITHYNDTTLTQAWCDWRRPRSC